MHTLSLRVYVCTCVRVLCTYSMGYDSKLDSQYNTMMQGHCVASSLQNAKIFSDFLWPWRYKLELHTEELKDCVLHVVHAPTQLNWNGSSRCTYILLQSIRQLPKIRSELLATHGMAAQCHSISVSVSISILPHILSAASTVALRFIYFLISKAAMGCSQDKSSEIYLNSFPRQLASLQPPSTGQELWDLSTSSSPRKLYKLHAAS